MEYLCNVAYTSGVMLFYNKLAEKLERWLIIKPKIEMVVIDKETLSYVVHKDLEQLRDSEIKECDLHLQSWLRFNVKQYRKCKVEYFKEKNYFTINFDLRGE